MQKLLTGLIDSIFPPTDNEQLLRLTTPDAFVTLAQFGNHHGSDYLTHYTDKLVRTAVTENKFNHHPTAAKLLGALLKNWSDTQPDTTLYIPIPLGPKRQRERGHNQAETVLRQARVKNINTTLLKRAVETKQQTTLHKSERQKNMQNVFAYTNQNIDWTSFTQVIIFDDVVTTGATLLAARATLAPHLPPHLKLRCLAIAH